MLIELMAGKAAAVKACCYDATPFTFTEDDDPITYFGHCLRKGPPRMKLSLLYTVFQKRKPPNFRQ